MTQTEVAEFLARMSEIRKTPREICPDCGASGCLGAAPDGRQISCETCGGHEDALGSGYIEGGEGSDILTALDVIDFLVAEKKQIRREAFLEAASVYCEACKNEGAPTLESNGLHFHSQALHGCTSFKIWCKLAEEDGG